MPLSKEADRARKQKARLVQPSTLDMVVGGQRFKDKGISIVKTDNHCSLLSNGQYALDKGCCYDTAKRYGGSI